MLRTHLPASRAVVGALSLSLLATAGCASFDPNPAAPPAAGPAASVTAAATPGAPAAAAGQPEVPAVVPDFLTGMALLGDQPIANAPFTVLDAVTNQPIAGARQVTIDGILPAAALRTDANGLMIFTLPQGFKGDLVRVAVQTPDGAFLNSLLLVSATPRGYELAATTGTCGTSPVAVKTSLRLSSDFPSTPSSATWKANFASDVAKSLGISENRIQIGNLSSGYSLANCDPKAAFKLDITSTLTSGAMSGVLALMKGGAGTSAADLLDAAKRSAAALDAKFGSNAASQQAAYDAYKKDPKANEGYGLGLAYKQVEDLLDAAGVSKADLKATVEATFSAILKKLQANPTNLTSLVITKDDLPSTLNLDPTKLKTGVYTYTDPTSNEVITVTGPTPLVTDVVVPPILDFTDEEDFFSAEAKLKPTVTVSYQEGDGTSPLRLTVAQKAETFDVKTISASISRSYVKAVNLAARTTNAINDTTTVTDPALAPTGWSTLTGGLPHRVTAAAPTSTAFTGEWRFGGMPGTKIADVAIRATSGAVKVDLTFAIAGNNAVRTKGGQVVMDLFKDVIDLDVAKIKALPAGSDNIVTIGITSRSGQDLTPANSLAADSEAAAYMTRPVVVVPPAR